MKLLLALALVLLIPSPGTASDDVPSDAEIFSAVRTEYVAQHQAVIEAFQLWLAAPSGIESLTALNVLEGAITETLDRLGAMEVRGCFEVWHRAALQEFETLAADIALARSGLSPTFSLPQFWYMVVNDPAFIELMACSEETA